jgi:hypothetical protein
MTAMEEIAEIQNRVKSLGIRVREMRAQNQDASKEAQEMAELSKRLAELKGSSNDNAGGKRKITVKTPKVSDALSFGFIDTECIGHHGLHASGYGDS